MIFLVFSCKSDKDVEFVASDVHFLNSGFEQKAGIDFPENWKLPVTERYSATQVADVKHSGAYSLRVVGRPADPTTYINVSQRLSFNYKQVKRIRMVGYIKTEKLKGSVMLWYHIFDAKDRKIDFGNSQSYGVMATGTKDWQKYAMDIIVNKDAAIVNFGAYVSGTGTVWLDDFSVEEIQEAVDKPTPEVVKLNKEFIDIVKQGSIYKDSINWKSVDEDLALLGKGLKSKDDALLLNRYVLQRLRNVGDDHSFIQSTIGAEDYASGKVSHPKPKAELLANGIGYISVPSFGSVNDDAMGEFASSIQTLIKRLDSENDIKGWVVDLRTNTGGNMYPMISGLGPLLDAGEVGYFIKDGKSYPWKLTENGIGLSVKTPYQVKNKNNKIAVLIGPKTSSSGEMTAICFIGQQNTKLFGEPSGGYTTANQMFKLSDGSNLFLATGYVADRNHKKYLDKIYPDVIVPTPNDQDAALKRAKTWLKDK